MQAHSNTMYQFNRDGVMEKVKPERWGWGVVYKDGAELHQFGEDGVFHQFREIEQEKVSLFVMYRLEDMNKRHDVLMSEKMKMIHFYRNIRPAHLDHFIRIYVFGYEKKIGGRTYKNLFFILPDDRVVVSDTDNVDLIKFNLELDGK